MILFLVSVCSAGVTGSIDAKANYFTSSVHGQVETGTNLHHFGTVNGTYNVVGVSSTTITNGYTMYDQETSGDTGIVHQADVTTLGSGLSTASVGMYDAKSNIPTTLCDTSQLVVDPTNVTGQYPSTETMEMSQTAIFNNGTYSMDAYADDVTTGLATDLEADTGSHASTLRGSVIAGASKDNAVPNTEIHEGRSSFAASGVDDPKIINEDGEVVGISSKQSIVWDFGPELEDLVEDADKSTNLTESINSTVNATEERI